MLKEPGYRSCSASTISLIVWCPGVLQGSHCRWVVAFSGVIVVAMSGVLGIATPMLLGKLDLTWRHPVRR